MGKELLEAILARFDPDRLETDIRAGLARSRVIKQAMARTRTHWDHTPYTDPTQQYWHFRLAPDERVDFRRW